MSPAIGAGTDPRWELGVGVAVLDLPLYRGATARRPYLLPFPHLIYRGERFRVDEGEVRGRLFRSERVKLDLSLGGGVPVASDGDSPRAGMPDLDPTGEIGPELDLRLWHRVRTGRSIWLRLPVRAAVSAGSGGLAHQGWITAPFVEFRLERRHPRHWKVGLALGPLYADEDYHNYFYGVAPAFATGRRAAYRAPGGYSGSRATVTLHGRFGDYWAGAFLRYDALGGAVFRDSPLVTSRRYLAFGVALARVFARGPAAQTAEPRRVTPVLMRPSGYSSSQR